MRRALPIAIILAGAAVAAADPQVAKRLFDEARAQYTAGKYVEACVLFERSYELDPAVGTRLNVAECAERAGKFRAAWLLYTDAADEYDRTDRGSQAKFARDKADALAPKLATVIVHVRKPKLPKLKIRIGDREVPAEAELVERLEPGTIEIAAHAPGYEPIATSVEATRGARVDVNLAALLPVESDKPPRNPWASAAYVSGGATVITFGAWIWALHGLAQTGGSFPNYGTACTELANEPARCNSGPQLQTVANVTAIATITGVVLTTAFAIQAIRTRPAVAPIVTPDHVGVAIGVRW